MTCNDNYVALQQAVAQLTAQERLAEIERLWDLLDAKCQALMFLIVDSFASFSDAYPPNGLSKRRELRNAQAPVEN